MRHKHILIAGPGRTGTTFLLRLLKNLGFDCGKFEKDTIPLFTDIAAGLDYRSQSPDLGPNNPEVQKHPIFSWTIPDIDPVKMREMVSLVLIPTRSMGQCVSSRMKIRGGAGGGMRDLLSCAKYGCSDPNMAIPLMVGHLVWYLSSNDLPYTTMSFPRHATDAEYSYEKLSCILDGLPFSEFRQVFDELSRPDLVHRY